MEGVVLLFHGFSREALIFLDEIRANNTKAWFEAHRDRYESLILEPSRAFVTEMGAHLQALVPTINAVPKVNGSLFRIYRDIRFRKDKRPIKHRIGIIFWQGGGRRMQSSACYLHFDPEGIFFAAGIRGFSDETRMRYRDYLLQTHHREALAEIMASMQWQGLGLPDPHYKRLPQGFDERMPHAGLSLYNSMFVYRQMAHPEAFFSADLCDFAYAIYEQMLPMQQWVYEMTLHDG